MPEPSPNDICCPVFDPTPWQDQEITWEGKLFVRDRVRALFHIPLNFSGVMTRNMGLIEAAGAKTPGNIVISDENSLFGSDVYIEASKDVPGAEMATLTGTFLTKVFEGPYSAIQGWVKEMQAFAAGRGKAIQHLYFYYTTCPKCAKKYGKNYVVMLAKI